MPQEVSSLVDALQHVERRDGVGTSIWRGALEGEAIVVGRTGVGKVNAALGAVALMRAGATAVVFSGLAGSLTSRVGILDLVVAEDFVQHDVDLQGLGYRPGCLPSEPLAWLADAGLSEACHQAALSVADRSTVHRGRIATGDQFIASAVQRERIEQQFDALCVEMEGAAAAAACQDYDIPFAAVRSISDTADGDAVQDFPVFVQQAADRGLALIRALVSAGSWQAEGGTRSMTAGEWPTR